LASRFGRTASSRAPETQRDFSLDEAYEVVYIPNLTETGKVRREKE
jgi:hypothetical protein